MEHERGRDEEETAGSEEQELDKTRTFFLALEVRDAHSHSFVPALRCVPVFFSRGLAMAGGVAGAAKLEAAVVPGGGLLRASVPVWGQQARVNSVTLLPALNHVGGQSGERCEI